MRVAFGYDGSMIVRDGEDKVHLFCRREAKVIQTAVYKWVQKKDKGGLLI